MSERAGSQGAEKQPELPARLRFYRHLLRLFPSDFRAEFGIEMEQYFRDRHAELERRGKMGLFKLWWETLTDLACSARREHWDSLRQDTRFAVRTLQRHPGFTAVALLTLALGVGANTAVFSVVNPVLLTPLPYPESNQLVRIYDRNMRWNVAAFSVSPSHYFEWRERVEGLSALGAYRESGFNLMLENHPLWVSGVRMTSSLFEVLGVDPQLGRWFDPSEDSPGGADVVVLSHGLWQRAFGADPGVIDRPLEIDGKAHRIVGVMPAGFSFPQREDIDLFVPYQLAREQGGHFLRVLGRLKAGSTLEGLNGEMNALAANAIPAEGWEVLAVSLREDVVESVSQPLWILAAAVGLVLLIACANIAGLLLARGSSREMDLAVRSALGASRSRLMRQMLTESGVLSLLGGTGGVALAWGSLKLLLWFRPANLPRQEEISVDTEVLVFALAISLLTSLLFGLLPSLRTSTSHLKSKLRTEAGTDQSGGRGFLRSALVCGEIALALALLVAAGLLIQSLRNEQGVELGYRPESVLTIAVSPLEARYPSNLERASVYRRYLEAVRSVPGVEAAGMVHRLPLSGTSAHVVVVEGREVPEGKGPETAIYYAFTPGYLESMGIPLLRGRLPTEQETFEQMRVALISRTLAETYFPNQDPIGKRVLLAPEPTPVWLEIIGIVADTRNDDLVDGYAPTFYFPYLSYAVPGVVLAVRTAGVPQALLPAIRAAISSVDPAQPLGKTQTMEAYLADVLSLSRFKAWLMMVFALIALVLTAVGTYGVVSFSVSRRTHEIGLRMALGAKGRDILLLVLRDGLVLAGAGVLLGSSAAYGLAQLLSSSLFGIEALDIRTFAMTSLILILVTLAATCLPARRAIRLNPVSALRSE